MNAARDLIGLAGFASLMYGCWLVTPALSWTLGGGLLLLSAIIWPFPKGGHADGAR